MRRAALQRLKELERAELDAAAEEWARDALRQRGLGDWVARHLDLWAQRFDRLGRWMKALAILVSAAASVLAVAYKIVPFMKARQVERAEELATGTASTALDRVDRPARAGRSAEPPRRP